MTTISPNIDQVNGAAVADGVLPVLVAGTPNTVVLSLTCVGDDITLTGGKVVPPFTARGPASVYLGFPDRPEKIFTDPSMFIVTPPAGWNAKFLDTPTFRGWALAPEQNVTFH